jgi:hypothetical protein
MAKDIVASHDIYFREFCKRQRSFNLLSTWMSCYKLSSCITHPWFQLHKVYVWKLELALYCSENWHS